MKAIVKILLGNGESILTEFITTTTREYLSNQKSVEIIETEKESVICQAAKKNAHDLIILILNNITYDLSLDKMDRSIIQKGEDLVVRVKSVSQTPLIAMTGLRGDRNLPERLRKLGANAFFYLPFDEERFNLALECCLNRSR